MDMSEVEKHNSEGDAWIVIDGKVLDVSMFMNFHPGSKHLLVKVAGTDCTEEFYSLHRQSVLENFQEKLQIGTVKGKPVPPARDLGALSLVPYAEWISPFESEKHRHLRRACREFIEREICPYVSEWEEAGEYPDTILPLMGKFGYIAASLGPGKHLKFVDQLPSGIKPEEFDYAAERIVQEELKRCGSWALCDGLGGGTVIGLPPVLNFGSPELVQRIVPGVLRGEKRICLAITDPYAGSDVASSTAVAKKSADGSHYIVTGLKKWITGGYPADYFTTLVRTGGAGHGGLSLLLIERTEGVTTKRIKTSYSSVANTSLITFEDVKVPVGNLLGKEGEGFKLAMANFNHERWGMAVGGNRHNRLIIEECYKWAYNRKVFGKRLIHQPQIQERLAEMCAYTDSVSALIDNVTYKMDSMSYAEQTKKLSGAISLLKNQQVQASRVVNDGAIQIFGGRALTKTGLGSKLENFQRTYQYGAILGGASSVLATQAIREAIKKFPEDARL